MLQSGPSTDFHVDRSSTVEPLAVNQEDTGSAPVGHPNAFLRSWWNRQTHDLEVVGPSRASRFEFWRAHQSFAFCRRGGTEYTRRSERRALRACEFESRRRYHFLAPVAQRMERPVTNREGEGLNPSRGAILISSSRASTRHHPLHPQAPASGRASVARVDRRPRCAIRASPQLWCRRSS